MDCSTPGFPVLHHLPELAQTLLSIESVMPSNHLILCHPLLLLPSIFPSIRAFANESVLRIRWPRYWSFSFCISPFNEYSGLILLGLTGLILLSKGLSRVCQHHNLKTSILWQLAFFLVQHPVHDHWKNHSFDERNFVGEVMSLLFNMMSRLFITFIPRSKRL